MAQTRHLATKSDTVEHLHPRVLARLSKDMRYKCSQNCETEGILEGRFDFWLQKDMDPVISYLPSKHRKQNLKI